MRRRTLEDLDITRREAARRFALGALGLGLPTVLGCEAFGPNGYGSTLPAGTQRRSCSDRDPNDASGQGRNCVRGTDSDAHDRATGGCSDRDPNDAPGAGLNCGSR